MGSCDLFPTLTEQQANPLWEVDGVAGDPSFSNYKVNGHGMPDGSTAVFHLTSASTNAIDRGTNGLPASLRTLLHAFGVNDDRRGSAYDLGRYEAGFAIVITPAT